MWLRVDYNRIPIYPIFYLLEGDCNEGSTGIWLDSLGLRGSGLGLVGGGSALGLLGLRVEDLGVKGLGFRV